MAEVKEYVNYPDANGSINISEDVIAIIAANTAKEVEGVASLYNSPSRDFAEMLGKKSGARGVKVKLEGGSIYLDVYVTTKLGSAVSEVAENIQNAVAAQVEATVGMNVSQVNVHVCSVDLRK